MTYQKSKISFMLLAIMAVALTGTIASSDTANAAKANPDTDEFRKTIHISNFRGGSEVCNYLGDDTHYQGKTNKRSGSAEVTIKDDNDSNSVAAYIWKTMRFTQGDKIELSVKADTTSSVKNGNVHITAYIAKKSTMYFNQNECKGNGAAIGSTSGTAFLLTQTWNGKTNTSNDYAEPRSVITIPETALYAVVVYVDASSKVNGGDLEATVKNAVVTLDYRW